MKRILFAAAASLMMTAPLAASAFAQPGHNYPPPQQQQEPRNHRDDNRADNRNDSHSYRTKWRDTRKDARWDAKVHNGYYIRNKWHAGQPSASAYRKSGFQLGYKPWKRGDRLGDFNKRYVEVDYRSQHLAPPPRGQHYVKDDNTGDIILAAIATGVIISILSN
ncbi:MAG: RcnB family protein [Hyphomonadaceae bacterium]